MQNKRKHPGEPGGRPIDAEQSLEHDWHRRFAELPSLWVVEPSPLWTTWLRRELAVAQLNIRCCQVLPSQSLARSRPIAVAWSVRFENLAETLESMWKLSQRRSPTLQLALIGDDRIESIGIRLRELGATHVQYQWTSASVVDRLLNRFWKLNLPPGQDVLDKVVRHLPLRPGSP